MFRVNRIKQVERTGISGVMVTDYSFARRFQDTFSTFVGEGTTTVKVLFSKRIAPYIRESLWHGSQQLTALPGVGRKTANVVLGHALGVPGLPVDRHVLRVANRIGIAASSAPDVPLTASVSA